MPVRAFLVGLALSFALAGVAMADTTVAFYSHGWGVRMDGFMYFPHAFVVVRRDGPDGARSEASYGFTAVSQGPDALAGPTRGIVKPAAETYRKQAALHFTVSATDAEYQAMQAVIAAWGGPGAAPYDLRRHDCVDFVAALAAALDLKLPAAYGIDPAKFLEQVRRLNADRITSAAPTLSRP